MKEEICVYHSPDLFFHHTITPTDTPFQNQIHAHEMHEVLVILSGEGVMLVEGNEHPFTSGSVLLMRAGESHRIRLNSGHPYERLGIRFHPSLISSLDPEGILFVPFQERRLGTGNLFHLYCLEGLLPAVMELTEESSSYRIRLTLISFLTSLLVEASNLYVKKEQNFQERKELGKIYDIIEYVNHNLSLDLSLDAIAGRFYLSKSQLSRSFKKATGSTLWDYVLIKRLLLARSLIREGEGISEACEKSGFREYSSFYRAYKKRFGISPNRDRPLTKTKKSTK